ATAHAILPSALTAGVGPHSCPKASDAVIRYVKIHLWARSTSNDVFGFTRRNSAARSPLSPLDEMHAPFGPRCLPQRGGVLIISKPGTRNACIATRKAPPCCS